MRCFHFVRSVPTSSCLPHVLIVQVQLKERHGGRLGKAGGLRYHLRRSLAPPVARLALESTSLRDMVLYGLPVLGAEIGRGALPIHLFCAMRKLYYFHLCPFRSILI